MSKIDYRGFIQDNFIIKNKEGLLVPFIFNETQNYYYDEVLIKEYEEELQGLRENILKFRQPGFSSLITGIFATDFIFSELDWCPLINSDVYSHKDDETKVHVQRFNMFLESWMLNTQGGDYRETSHRLELPKLRKDLLKIDSDGDLIGKRGAEYHAQTASAKVSGRGGTKQNIHWSEPAHYPNTQIMNAKLLMTGAEEQVPSGRGKIFRETTGNTQLDYFALEYKLGKEGKSEFKSRFLGWFMQSKEYRKLPPVDWSPPEYYDKLLKEGLADIEQCFWHFEKTRGLTDKTKMRENPTYEVEAFILGGKKFFNEDALLHYVNQVKKPMLETMYVSAL